MTHKQFWIQMAGYYRTRLDDSTVLMYAQDVSHVSIEKLQELFLKYRSNPANKFMPMPSWFIEQINPTHQDPKILAREVASRIQAAISKFGYCNPIEAKEYIGSVGWMAVQRNGGWLSVCENVGVTVDPSIFYAQTRDLAESIIINAAKENFDKPIELPERKQSEGLTKAFISIENRK